MGGYSQLCAELNCAYDCAHHTLYVLQDSGITAILAADVMVCIAQYISGRIRGFMAAYKTSG